MHRWERHKVGDLVYRNDSSKIENVVVAIHVLQPQNGMGLVWIRPVDATPGEWGEITSLSALEPVPPKWIKGVVYKHLEWNNDQNRYLVTAVDDNGNALAKNLRTNLMGCFTPGARSSYGVA